MWRKITYWYTVFHIKTKLNQLLIDSNITVDKSKPILLLSNHFSLWDGFISLYICQKMFGKKFHFLINEREYNERSFLRKIGGLPLSLTPRKLIQQISKANSILDDKDNLLLHYPQNQFESLNLEKINLKETILSRLNTDNAQIFFLTNIVEFENSFKPSFHIKIEEIRDLSILTNLYQNHLQEHRSKISESHQIK